MSLTIIKAIRLKKRHVAILAVLTAFVLSFLALRLNWYLENVSLRQSVAVLAPSVANKVIIVDPGHGGLEKDITLALGKRLAVYLEQAGAKVWLTRETDADLSDAATLAHKHKADLLISLHVNSYPGNEPHGAQTFVQPGSPASKQAGQAIQSALSAQLKHTDRLTQEVDDDITRNTPMPAVLVQAGFMADVAESRLLLDPAYQGKVSWAVYAGIVQYFSAVAEANAVLDKEEIIKIFKAQSPDYLDEP